MPRGTCENCGRDDVFLYAVPLTLGTNVFVCPQCLTLLHDWEDDEDDDDELYFRHDVPVTPLIVRDERNGTKQVVWAPGDED